MKRKVTKFIGGMFGFFLYVVFFFWVDCVRYFVYMVRRQNAERWQKVDDAVVAYQKAHMDDLQGGNDGNN